MLIPIGDPSRLLLEKLLHEHKDGKSRLLWRTYDSLVPARYRTIAARRLLNRLHQQRPFLSVDGRERDLLLNLLAWTVVSDGNGDEKLTAKQLLDYLQPQGAPIGAEIGDAVALQTNGDLVEIAHFSGCGDMVTTQSQCFVVGTIQTDSDSADPNLVFCELYDLVWPAHMPAEAIIGTPLQSQIAA